MLSGTLHTNPTETSGLYLFCPLCASDEYQIEKTVAVAALRDYWRKFDYDLDADFPGLPETLSERRCINCGLHCFDPLVVGPPSLYEHLAAWPPYYRADAWEWDIAIDILLQYGIEDVLEVGSGTGEFLERAAQLLPHCEGLEFNPVAVVTARSQGVNISDRPLESIEKGRSGIVAFQLLEHLEDPAEFLKTCAAKLRPGGLLIVAVPNQDGFIGMLDANYLNCPPHHVTLWRKSCFDVVAKQLALDFIDYRTAPLERQQYKIYLQRHTKPSPTFAGKLSNLATRLFAEIAALLIFPLARRTLAGEAHLAVFRKPLS